MVLFRHHGSSRTTSSTTGRCCSSSAGLATCFGLDAGYLRPPYRLARDPAGTTPLDTARLCARWCAAEFPEYDWAPLVGLLHDVGRILAHPMCAAASSATLVPPLCRARSAVTSSSPRLTVASGPARRAASATPLAQVGVPGPSLRETLIRRCGGQPEWTVAGESYPLGCAFSDRIRGAQFLCACSDRRCHAYLTPLGIYEPHCGLDRVAFTFSGPEYLSLVLQQAGVRLPYEALFLVRHQDFDSALLDDGAYACLMAPRDRAAMPLLRRFVAARAAARRGAVPSSPAWNATCAQCNTAMRQYFDFPELAW